MFTISLQRHHKSHIRKERNELKNRHRSGRQNKRKKKNRFRGVGEPLLLSQRPPSLDSRVRRTRKRSNDTKRRRRRRRRRRKDALPSTPDAGVGKGKIRCQTSWLVHFSLHSLQRLLTQQQRRGERKREGGAVKERKNQGRTGAIIR